MCVCLIFAVYFDVCTGASDCLERLISEMTCRVCGAGCRTLPTHSLFIVNVAVMLLLLAQLVLVQLVVVRVPTVQGKLEKSGNFTGQGKVRGKYFFLKKSWEKNEKLVPPDVRFSG